MISKKMLKELTQQINEELYSSYLYQAMSSYCLNIGFKGAAKWLAVQAKEETGHGMKIYDYLHKVGEHAVLMAIAEPPAKYASLKEIFLAAFKHEQHITSRIGGLMDLAAKDNDYATQSFLKWFVDEQVEEEEQTSEIVKRLEIAGDKGSTLLYLDKELGKRE